MKLTDVQELWRLLNGHASEGEDITYVRLEAAITKVVGLEGDFKENSDAVQDEEQA